VSWRAAAWRRPCAGRELGTHAHNAGSGGARPKPSGPLPQPLACARRQQQDVGARFGPLPPGAPDIFAAGAGAASDGRGLAAPRAAGAGVRGSPPKARAAARPAARAQENQGSNAAARHQQQQGQVAAPVAKRQRAALSPAAPATARARPQPLGASHLRAASHVAATAHVAGGPTFEAGFDAGPDAAASERQQRLQRLKQRRLVARRPAAPGGAPLGGAPRAPPGAAPAGARPSMAERVRFFREAPPMPRDARTAWAAALGMSDAAGAAVGAIGAPALAPLPASPPTGLDWGGFVAGQGSAPNAAAPLEAEAEEGGGAAGVPAGLTAAQYDDLTEKLLERCRKLLSSCGAQPPAGDGGPALVAGLAPALGAPGAGAGHARGAAALRSPMRSPMHLRLQALLAGVSPSTRAAAAAASLAASGAARRAEALSPPEAAPTAAPTAAGGGSEQGLSWRERLVSRVLTLGRLRLGPWQKLGLASPVSIPPAAPFRVHQPLPWPTCRAPVPTAARAAQALRPGRRRRARPQQRGAAAGMARGVAC
jgi:hypothetical protein